jgi:putative acetyltransferase
MLKMRAFRDQDFERIMDIWRHAVDATYDFLSAADRTAIEHELLAFFPTVTLELAVDAADIPQGFMFLHDGHLEALFVHPDQHGKGIGRAMMKNAIAIHPELTTDVAEQNPQALGFYERLGFVRTGRSGLDGQGRPYPLIHLRYDPYR